ncbi:MAG: L,D-transpeptidase [Patescibacteria group bacterium]
MKRKVLVIGICFIVVLGIALFFYLQKPTEKVFVAKENDYWLLLHRKSQKEFLYQGKPGDIHQSKLIRTFVVKTGRPGERPTPLPQLAGREYWLLTRKAPSDNPETAPYFLTLDVPGWEEAPFGPVPYLECNGQCNWELPGEFGLHGVNGDPARLSDENPGSSGCIRHTDKDITYLYELLDPEDAEVRYYMEDK